VITVVIAAVTVITAVAGNLKMCAIALVIWPARCLEPRNY
jgi:hypothetical protein